jgi:hypothetical protein
MPVVFGVYVVRRVPAGSCNSELDRVLVQSAFLRRVSPSECSAEELHGSTWPPELRRSVATGRTKLPLSPRASRHHLATELRLHLAIEGRRETWHTTRSRNPSSWNESVTL